MMCFRRKALVTGYFRIYPVFIRVGQIMLMNFASSFWWTDRSFRGATKKRKICL